MKSIITLLLMTASLLFGYDHFSTTPSAAINSSASRYDRETSGQQVQGQGSVSKVLADDNQGSRHQRFLIRLASGQSLLVAHNIDLAPRIPDLATGDLIEFNGVYEWNERGGVIHWTHQDPANRHVSGWLKHHGQIYQ